MTPARRVQIAPMMGITDYDFRHFLRGLTREAELWTEMVVDSTILHANLSCLRSSTNGHLAERGPVVLQLGSGDPAKAEAACERLRTLGTGLFDEVNLNAGCPSVKVAGRGCFGASLMVEPRNIADIMRAMRRGLGPYSSSPSISLKTRVGVDYLDSPEYLNHLLRVATFNTDCKTVILHARKAWLNGVSPSRNRTVPALRWDRVFLAAAAFPSLDIYLNGGVKSLDTVETLLSRRWRPANEPWTTYETHPPYTSRSGNPTDLSCAASFEVNGAAGRAEPAQPTKETQARLVPVKEERLLSMKQYKRELRDRPRTEVTVFTTGGTIVDIPKSDYAAFRSSQTSSAGSQFLTEAESFEKMMQLESASSIKGVMIGRAAYTTPCILANVDSRFYNVPNPESASTLRSVANYYLDYLDAFYGTGIASTTIPGACALKADSDSSSLSRLQPSTFLDEHDCSIYTLTGSLQRSLFSVLKPVLNLLAGRQGAKHFRYKLDELVRGARHIFCAEKKSAHFSVKTAPEASSTILRAALDYIDEHFPGVLDQLTSPLSGGHR